MKTVFLGGTCNGSRWRDALIPLLPACDCFNPVVEHWTQADQDEERRRRQTSDYNLYVLTPQGENLVSIAELTDDSNKRPAKTLLLVLPADGAIAYSQGQLKHMAEVGKLVAANGARVFATQQELVDFLNA